MSLQPVAGLPGSPACIHTFTKYTGEAICQVKEMHEYSVEPDRILWVSAVKVEWQEEVKRLKVAHQRELNATKDQVCVITLPRSLTYSLTNIHPHLVVVAQFPKIAIPTSPCGIIISSLPQHHQLFQEMELKLATKSRTSAEVHSYHPLLRIWIPLHASSSCLYIIIIKLHSYILGKEVAYKLIYLLCKQGACMCGLTPRYNKKYINEGIIDKIEKYILSVSWSYNGHLATPTIQSACL